LADDVTVLTVPWRDDICIDKSQLVEGLLLGVHVDRLEDTVSNVSAAWSPCPMGEL
jgi:hypothetical protein